MTATWKTFCQDRRRCWIAELTIEAEDAGALLALVDQALGQLEARGYAPLDPFAGTATTVWEAARAGRLGVGVDLCPAYLDRAVTDWQAHQVKGQGGSKV